MEESSTLLKVLTLLRQVAFIAFVYLCLGWLVDRKIEAPDSKVRAFFKIVCSPVTRPVSRFVAPGTAYSHLIKLSVGVIAATWVALIVVTEVLRRG